MTDPEYFSLDLPSASSTKILLSGTNAHLAWERSNPSEETDALALGALVHALVLAPETVETAFIRVGRLDRRTKEGRAEWETIHRRAALSGARVVTEDQVRAAQAMADSVLEHPPARTLLRNSGEREIVCIGDLGGRPAKAKIDALIEIPDPMDPITIIADLKTCTSASPREFAASAARFGYYHQAAWYCRLVSQHRRVDDFLFIAVEKDPPYLCAVYRVPASVLEAADSCINSLANRWWDVQQGARDGYPVTIMDLDPPRWWNLEVEPTSF